MFNGICKPVIREEELQFVLFRRFAQFEHPDNFKRCVTKVKQEESNDKSNCIASADECINYNNSQVKHYFKQGSNHEIICEHAEPFCYCLLKEIIDCQAGYKKEYYKHRQHGSYKTRWKRIHSAQAYQCHNKGEQEYTSHEADEIFHGYFFLSKSRVAW
jgi:hypothetical protein